MADKPKSDQKREDEILKRMLETPPQPHDESKRDTKKTKKRVTPAAKRKKN